MSTASTTAPTTGESRGFPGLAQLQRLGRSLMLPIASLPAAALLLRLGQQDMLGEDGLAQVLGDWLDPVAAVIGAAGGALFANLPLHLRGRRRVRVRPEGRRLDRAGRPDRLPGVQGRRRRHVAVRPGRDAQEGATQELINFGVLGGIVIGIAAALLWQRYYRIKLPPYLAFFGGRRFVPIITALAAIVIGVLMSFVYPPFDAGMTEPQRMGDGERGRRWWRVRVAQPAAHPGRSAPHPELHRHGSSSASTRRTTGPSSPATSSGSSAATRQPARS